MNSLWTVIRFTFLGRFRSKSFRIMTVVLALILSALINLPYVIDKLSSHEPDKIGVFEEKLEIAGQLTDYFGKQQDAGVTIVPLPPGSSADDNEKTAKQKIKDGDIKGFLEFEQAADGGFPKATYKSESTTDFGTQSQLQAALESVKTKFAVQGSGLSETQLAKLFAPVAFESVQISTTDTAPGGKTESQMKMAYALVYFMLLLLYMTVLIFGNMVATEVTAEKSSRVMEILIASVAPLKQMFGKIIGICLLGIIQITVIVLIGYANLRLPHNSKLLDQIGLNMNDLPLGLVAYFLLFYIGGYLIYATLFAAVGSLVSRTEEVGQAIMPITFLVVGAFMIAMFGLQNPTAPFVVAMSYVPFFSPLIMFLRIGMSDPAWWEIGLSIAVLAGSILAFGWLAAKIYRTGVLMYGKRPSFRELRKAMQAFKV